MQRGRARRVLKSLCMKERQVGLDDFVETSDRDAFLCYGYLAHVCFAVAAEQSCQHALCCASSRATSYYITLILRWYRTCTLQLMHTPLPQAIYHPLIYRPPKVWECQNKTLNVGSPDCFFLFFFLFVCFFLYK